MAISTMILIPSPPIIPQTSLSSASFLDIAENNGAHATSTSVNNPVSGRNNNVISMTSLVSSTSPRQQQQSQQQLQRQNSTSSAISAPSLSSSSVSSSSTSTTTTQNSIEGSDFIINPSWHNNTTSSKTCYNNNNEGMILLHDSYTEGLRGIGAGRGTIDIDEDSTEEGPSYPIADFMCNVKIMESTLGSTAIPSSSLSGGSNHSCLTKFSTASSNGTSNSFAAENSKEDDDDDEYDDDDYFDEDEDMFMNKKRKKNVRFSLYDENDDSSLLAPSCIYIYENPLHILLEVEEDDTRDDTNEVEESPVVDDTNDENDDPNNHNLNNSPSVSKKLLDLECEEEIKTTSGNSTIEKQALVLSQQQQPEQEQQWPKNSLLEQQQQLQAHVNSKIWWTEEEHIQIRTSIKEKCSMIRSKTPSKIQELIFCFKNCRLPDGFDTSIQNDIVLSSTTTDPSQGSDKQVDSTIRQQPNDTCKNSRLLKMNDELITDILNEWVINDDLRGLEKKMTSRFRQSSVQAVTAVLDCQDLIWNQQQQASSMLITSDTISGKTSFVVDANLTSTGMLLLPPDEMIRQRSMEASYRARLFAYRMALSDAKYAADAYKE